MGGRMKLLEKLNGIALGSDTRFNCSWKINSVEPVDANLSCALYDVNKNLIDIDTKKSLIYYGNINMYGIHHVRDNFNFSSPYEIIDIIKSNVPDKIKYGALILNIHNAKENLQNLGNLSDIKLNIFSIEKSKNIPISSSSLTFTNDKDKFSSDKDEGVLVGLIDFDKYYFTLLNKTISDVSDIISVVKKLSI